MHTHYFTSCTISKRLLSLIFTISFLIVQGKLHLVINNSLYMYLAWSLTVNLHNYEIGTKTNYVLSEKIDSGANTRSTSFKLF